MLTAEKAPAVLTGSIRHWVTVITWGAPGKGPVVLRTVQSRSFVLGLLLRLIHITSRGGRVIDRAPTVTLGVTLGQNPPSQGSLWLMFDPTLLSLG